LQDSEYPTRATSCDVGRDGDLEAVFHTVAETWGGLDIALHSIAFAPKDDLQGRLVDSSSEGFKTAMDISCHSFIRMARLAAPLMPDGGTLVAMSYHGANKTSAAVASNERKCLRVILVSSLCVSRVPREPRGQGLKAARR